MRPRCFKSSVFLLLLLILFVAHPSVALRRHSRSLERGANEKGRNSLLSSHKPRYSQQYQHRRAQGKGTTDGTAEEKKSSKGSTTESSSKKTWVGPLVFVLVALLVIGVATWYGLSKGKKGDANAGKQAKQNEDSGKNKNPEENEEEEVEEKETPASTEQQSPSEQQKETEAKKRWWRLKK